MLIILPGTSISKKPEVIYGSVHDVVTDRIREMILERHFAPGERLRQDDLATSLGVSTMPVREALRQLQAEGLVVFYPRKGAMVAMLSLSEYKEIYRIREELEILACRWVAEDFAKLPLPQLLRALNGLEAAEASQDIPRRLRLVREFFFIIFEASGKEHLLRILSSLWAQSEQYRRSFTVMREHVPSRLEHYRKIYQACADRDSEALIFAMRGLYVFVENRLMPMLRAQDTEGSTT